MVVTLVAGLCHLSFALHAACNSSRNASRSNAGQPMYAGMRHPVMPKQRSCVAGLNSLEWVVIVRTGQEYSLKEQQRARQHAVSVGIHQIIHLEFACLTMMMLRTFSCFISCIMLVVWQCSIEMDLNAHACVAVLFSLITLHTTYSTDLPAFCIGPLAPRVIMDFFVNSLHFCLSSNVE